MAKEKDKQEPRQAQKPAQEQKPQQKAPKKEAQPKKEAAAPKEQGPQRPAPPARLATYYRDKVNDPLGRRAPRGKDSVVLASAINAMQIGRAHV